MNLNEALSDKQIYCRELISSFLELGFDIFFGPIINGDFLNTVNGDPVGPVKLVRGLLAVDDGKCWNLKKKLFGQPPFLRPRNLPWIHIYNSYLNSNKSNRGAIGYTKFLGIVNLLFLEPCFRHIFGHIIRNLLKRGKITYTRLSGVWWIKASLSVGGTR